jgi:3-phosphoshikimate 1-carboxyvinyltransferase
MTASKSAAPSSSTPTIAATSLQSSNLAGDILVPGDKSISHRALMLSSQVLGTTLITGLLEGEDVLHTADALRGCGVEIRRLHAQRWEVKGVGIGGLKESARVIEMGNSGTSTRLLMGLLTPYPMLSFFAGDASLSKRPMKRVSDPLSQMGAQITAREGGKLPLLLQGTATPLPITYRLPVASAQVKSAILLAGLNTPGETTVIEDHPTRDHTERMLRALGVDITTTIDADGAHRITLRGQQPQTYADRTLAVPSDPSSAAFPVVAALITPGSRISIPNICINPTRIGLFDTLAEMGGKLTWKNQRELCGEPVADLVVEYSKLKGVTVPAERAPSMIDEYPILSIAASVAEGETVMLGLEELKVKESNRLAAIAHGLHACGVDAVEGEDSLTVRGGKVRGGATIPTHFDHRIAMSFLVMGLVSEQPVSVDNIECITTSFPGFIDLLNGLGAQIDAQQIFGHPRRRASDKIRQLPPMTIAIDGPAASGKGTLGHRLAEYCGYMYLDTGSLYRATALSLLRAGLDPQNEEAAVSAALSLTPSDCYDPALRDEAVGAAASVVSAMPGVRAALLEYQRQFARNPGGAILDGRDIGTVVCPDAEVKLYVTADMSTRAKRRAHQLAALGFEVDGDAVLRDLEARDKRDAERATAPLKPAEDAIQLDTTKLTINQVFDKVMQIITERSRSRAA